MVKYEVKVKGISPLLFNRFPDEENLEGKSKRSSGNPSQKEQVERSLYRTKTGKIYQPAEHFLGAMIKASVNFKMSGKKTLKDAVNSGVFIEPLQIIHESQKYEIDWRSVVIRSTRGRIMKGRARMNDWSLKFTLTCIDPRVTDKDIEDVLSYAGSYVGVGDYRPRYGRFEITSFKKLK